MQCIEEGSVATYKSDELVGCAISSTAASGTGFLLSAKIATLAQGSIHKVSASTHADAKLAGGFMVYPYISNTLWQQIQAVIGRGKGALLQQYFGSLVAEDALDPNLYKISLGWFKSYVLKEDAGYLAVGQVLRCANIIDPEIYGVVSGEEYQRRLGTRDEIALTPIVEIKWLELSPINETQAVRPKTPQWLIDHYKNNYDPWMGAYEEVQKQIKDAEDGL
ncbi:hypothetical protein CI807_23915 [Pseudomonas sp. NS1(2017)]|jgi:hypothetical protein|uniref:hypothetical protein n=1 Tax=Pseudomonas sp. NS1(2017) TaxID=2025658 RepID=UPI000BA212B8|nr:hypothetical protein [Pseudomonas sp. NS1(2017)]ASV39121.1 hypothetical protein CI807_23915 [Pseudomonas sp. NS1(2017)]